MVRSYKAVLLTKALFISEMVYAYGVTVMELVSKS